MLVRHGVPVTYVSPHSSARWLRGALWFAVSHFVQRIGSSYFLPSPWRVRCWRAAGVDIARSAQLASGISLMHPDKITVGADAFIGTGCCIENHAHVTLEDAVWVASGTTFATATHVIGESARRAGAFRILPIVVGRGTWIGADSTILPGVTIGRGCVIAAGAVVTADCDPDGLYAGVPAQRKRDLDSNPQD